LPATAIRIAVRYGGKDEAFHIGWFAMMAYVVNDGRLLALKPSEWFLMLAGVALTGFLALLI
jgi:hypothetical protein